VASSGPQCTQAAIQAALDVGKAPSDAPVVDDGSFKCSGNWGTASYTTPADSQEADFTGVVQWTGGAWHAVDGYQVCNAGEIPADLYQLACQSN
jgi:hypothetical protein